MTNTEINYILKKLAQFYLEGKLSSREFSRLHADYFFALKRPEIKTYYCKGGDE